MEMRNRVAEWAAQMGYTGKIPKNFENMCGPKTAHIWEQVVGNVKPKSHIQQIRGNILLQRIKNPSEVNDLLYPPIQELKLWEQKRKLKEEIRNVGKCIADNNQKISRTSVQNKIKYLQIDNTKAKTRAVQNKTFLLESKATALENDLAQAQEKLELCKSLTPEPVEQDASEVREVLKKCAEKIEGLLDEQSFNVCKGPSLIELSPQVEPHLMRQIQNVEDETLLLKDIKEVLHRSDSRLLWNVSLELMNKLSFELRNCITKELGNNVLKIEENSQIKNKLNARFIETELKTILHEQNIKQYQAALESQQRSVFEVLNKTNLQKNIIDEAIKLILLQKEEAGLKAVCDFMTAQIQALASSLHSTLELQEEQKKALNIEQQIVDLSRSIEVKRHFCKEIHSRLMNTRDEIPMYVHKLSPLIGDLHWASPLMTNVITKEIEVFKSFCLERNRKMTTGKHGELLTDELVGYDDLDTDSLYMLAMTIESPFSPCESILLKLIKDKQQLNVLTALPDALHAIDYKRYNLDELKKQESHVQHSISKLSFFMKPSNVNRIFSRLAKTKKEVELWSEMPSKDFVDPKRLFNGHNCSYYQSQYDSYYSQLQ